LSWGEFGHTGTFFQRPSPCDTHRFDSIPTHRHLNCDNLLISLPSYRPKFCLFISDPSDRHTLFGRVPFLHRSSTTSTNLLGVSNTICPTIRTNIPTTFYWSSVLCQAEYEETHLRQRAYSDPLSDGFMHMQTL
jgi:hypothetical protein